MNFCYTADKPNMSGVGVRVGGGGGGGLSLCTICLYRIHKYMLYTCLVHAACHRIDKSLKQTWFSGLLISKGSIMDSKLVLSAFCSVDFKLIEYKVHRVLYMPEKKAGIPQNLLIKPGIVSKLMKRMREASIVWLL